MVVFVNHESKKLIQNTLMKRVKCGKINNTKELKSECVKLGADQEVFECVSNNLKGIQDEN